MTTPWNMASARARNYKPPPKRKAIGPVGPFVVEPKDDVALVNGTPCDSDEFAGLTDDFIGCNDCGFTVCGCDRRCGDCGSLQHEACMSKWCGSCERTVTLDHDLGLCGAERLAKSRAAKGYAEYVRAPYALQMQIVDAFVEDREPPAEADPRQVLDTLNQWSELASMHGYRGMNERAKQRAMSWKISSEWRVDAKADSLAMLQLLHRQAKLNNVKLDPSALELANAGDYGKLCEAMLKEAKSRYTFPVQRGIEHGQQALSYATSTSTAPAFPLPASLDRPILGMLNELR